MPQHYIKIEIKGDERNLPEKGSYWFHFKKSNFWGEDMQLWDVEKLISIHKNTAFIRSIDWYFSPELQQPEQPESAELKQKYKALIEMYAMILTGLKLTKDEAISELTKLTSSILEDVSQSPSKAVIMPTEEDVEKEFPIKDQNVLMTRNNGLRQEGAKWFRSQVREVELKTALKDFNNFMQTYQGDDNIPTIDRCIGDYFDYLSARKEEK